MKLVQCCYLFHFTVWHILKPYLFKGRAFSVEFIYLIHSAYFTCRIIMPFRKPCPTTFRKLVRLFTLSEVKRHGADVLRASCKGSFKCQNMTWEPGRRGKAYINSVYFSFIHSFVRSFIHPSMGKSWAWCSCARHVQIRFTRDSAENSVWEGLQLAVLYWALYERVLEGERKAIKSSMIKMIRPVMIIFLFFLSLGVTRTGNFPCTSSVLVVWTCRRASSESGQ